MKESSVTFPSDQVSIVLEGRLHLPREHGPFPAAVICHPYPPAGGSMAVPVVEAIARALAQAGVAALRFNFRGVGASQGGFENGRGEVDDVAGALNWLSSRPEVCPDRVAVVGYSFGAAMALFHAARTGSGRPLALVGLPLGWNLSLPPLTNTNHPWLLMAAEKDQFCPVPDLHTFAQGLEGEVRVHIVAEADHFLFGYESDAAGVVTDFLQEIL
jgi:alpha/beta superfamily hydrolase